MIKDASRPQGLGQCTAPARETEMSYATSRLDAELKRVALTIDMLYERVMPALSNQPEIDNCKDGGCERGVTSDLANTMMHFVRTVEGLDRRLRDIAERIEL